MKRDMLALCAQPFKKARLECTADPPLTPQPETEAAELPASPPAELGQLASGLSEWSVPPSLCVKVGGHPWRLCLHYIPSHAYLLHCAPRAGAVQSSARGAAGLPPHCSQGRGRGALPGRWAPAGCAWCACWGCHDAYSPVECCCAGVLLCCRWCAPQRVWRAAAGHPGADARARGRYGQAVCGARAAEHLLLHHTEICEPLYVLFLQPPCAPAAIHPPPRPLLCPRPPYRLNASSCWSTWGPRPATSCSCGCATLPPARSTCGPSCGARGRMRGCPLHRCLYGRSRQCGCWTGPLSSGPCWRRSEHRCFPRQQRACCGAWGWTIRSAR